MNYTPGKGRAAKVRESKRKEREKKYTARDDETERVRGKKTGGGRNAKRARAGRQRIVEKKAAAVDGCSRAGRREKRIEFRANRVIGWKPPAVS